MSTPTVDIFNQLTQQYTNGIANVQTGSIAIGLELFNNIATISVGLLGLNYLLKKNVDMVEANIELIRWLMYMNVFFLFITNYQTIAPAVWNFFQQIGLYLGAKASGSTVDIKPGHVINIGFSIAAKIFWIDLKYGLLMDPLMILVSVVAAVVILYCFGVVAVDLILIQIGSQLILAGGVFLLAFAGTTWTRDYAERYVHTFFHVGLKMVFIYILVGIGMGFAQNWTHIMDQVTEGQIIEYEIALGMSSFVFFKLCQKLPDQAVVYLTGRLAMNYDTASSLHAAVKGAAAVATGLATKSVAMAASIQGNAKAADAARQAVSANFQAQGKTATPQEIQDEAIKTLGAARRDFKQQEWDKKVDETQDGKIAKTILDSIPKAQDA